MLQESESTIHTASVGSLLPADSPRLDGLSHDHVQVLAACGKEFEPILVHREAGRVVDGMHRLQAAILRGRRDIAVRYVEGSSAELFVRSVQANTSHGLPLTLKDRKAAVARILASHPHWSDRAIAAVAGVSPKTVGAARGRCSSEESPQSNQSTTARVGRDGRARPVDMPQRREKALALLTARPDVTLREVAQEAGVSISTVHRMRQELRSGPPAELQRGQTSAPPEASWPEEGTPATSSGPVAAARQVSHLTSVPSPPERLPPDVARPRARALHTLSNDPSIRFTDSGRALLRWLNGQAQALAAGEQLLESVPPHCARAVAEVASHYAKEWERLAGELRRTDPVNGTWRAAR
ncbi:helix-turn-helix domain-containing protein [Streptomyces sp. NPDC002004]